MHAGLSDAFQRLLVSNFDVLFSHEISCELAVQFASRNAVPEGSVPSESCIPSRNRVCATHARLSRTPAGKSMVNVNLK
jgi:hypothetical protein